MTARPTPYRGKYTVKLSDGTIESVQCDDTAGIGVPLSLADYRRRGIQPPAESLPDQHQWAAQQAAMRKATP